MTENVYTNTEEHETYDKEKKEDRVIQLMTSPDKINYLLQLTGKSHLCYADFVDIARVNGRLLFHIDVCDRAVRTRQRLHLDIIFGAPTFEQVADCVYGWGAQADQRIIIYDDDFTLHPERHPGNAYLVADLIALANTKGIPFSLVRAKNLSDVKDKRISYELNVDAFCVKREASRDFPTRRQLLEGEFWSFYYHLHWMDQGAGAVDCLESALGPWEPGYSTSGRRTRAIWNDDGLFMCVAGRLDDEGMMILKDHIDLLQDEYPGCPISIAAGDELVLSIRVLDVSMRTLIEMAPEEKGYYGGYLYEEEHHFLDVIEDALIKHDEMKDSKNAAE